MLPHQQTTIELSKLRAQINQIPELRSDDPEFATKQGERITLVRQMVDLDLKLVDQMAQEDREAQAAMSTTAVKDGWTAEMREFHELGQRTSIVEYMQAGLQQRQLSPGTPEFEYNSHVFGGSWSVGEYPLEMLLDRSEYFSLEAHHARQVHEGDMEQRTEITGVSSNAGNLSFVDRLLASSEAAYARAVFPAVGPGRHSYPIVSGSGVASVIARTTAETPAGGISVVNADPRRIQHSYEVSRSDELQMPGIMGYMAADLRVSLASGLDNVTIDDLVSGLTIALQTGNTTVTQNTLFEAIASGVDGVGARYFTELRVLAETVAVSAQTSFYAKAASFIGSADNGGAFNFLTGPNFRGSAHMATAAGGLGKAILIKLAPSAPRLIVPTWRRAEILRDTGRLQLQGSVTLTGAIYADVILVATDMHDYISVDTQ